MREPHGHDAHSHDAPAELFARNGLRCTRQRIALYEALASTTAHPTADELYQMVGDKVAGLSLATVYNALDAFCDAGIAIRIPGQGRNGAATARFDATVRNHVHLRCQDTGRVIDAPDDLSQLLLDHLPPHLLAEIEKSLGFRVEQVHVELLGSYKHAPAQPSS